MRQQGTQLWLSATDLANHLACAERRLVAARQLKHFTELDRRVAEGKLAKPGWTDPALDILRQRGKDHERAYVEHLRSSGKRVVDLEGVQDEPAVARTIDATGSGADRAGLAPAGTLDRTRGHPGARRRGLQPRRLPLARGAAQVAGEVIRNLLEEVLVTAGEERAALEITHYPSSRAPRPRDLPPGRPLGRFRDAAHDVER